MHWMSIIKNDQRHSEKQTDITLLILFIMNGAMTKYKLCNNYQLFKYDIVSFVYRGDCLIMQLMKILVPLYQG